jgi:hypothetical protein
MTRNAVMTVALFMFGYQAKKLGFEHRVQIELLIRTVFIGRRLKRRLREQQRQRGTASPADAPQLPDIQRGRLLAQAKGISSLNG